jgi:hypothetical protein
MSSIVLPSKAWCFRHTGTAQIGCGLRLVLGLFAAAATSESSRASLAACLSASCSAHGERGFERAIVYRADDDGVARTFEISTGKQMEFSPDELQADGKSDTAI